MGQKNWLLTSYWCSILIVQEVHSVAANLRRCIYPYLVWNSWSIIVPTASQWVCTCLWANNMQLYFEIFCQSIFPRCVFFQECGLGELGIIVKNKDWEKYQKWGWRNCSWIMILGRCSFLRLGFNITEF